MIGIISNHAFILINAFFFFFSWYDHFLIGLLFVLLCLQKEGRQRGTWNGKKADNDFYKKIVCSMIIFWYFCRFSNLFSVYSCNWCILMLLLGGCLWGKKSRTNARECWLKGIITLNAGNVVVFLLSVGLLVCTWFYNFYSHHLWVYPIILLSIIFYTRPVLFKLWRTYKLLNYTLWTMLNKVKSVSNAFFIVEARRKPWI